MRHWQHTRALARAGHRVSVVTSYVQHKERTIPERYAGRRVVHEREDGLDVWRTYSTPSYGRDLRSRLANYGTFALWSAVAGARAGKPDVVVASSPSLPSAAAAAALARARGARFLLEVRDLWPDSAVAMGLVRDPRVIAAARRLERYCYRRADRIVALTEGIRDGIIAERRQPGQGHPDHQRDRPRGRERGRAGRRPGARRRLRRDVRRRPRHLQLARDRARGRRAAARRPGRCAWCWWARATRRPAWWPTPPGAGWTT